VPGIIEHARRALALLPEQDLVWRSVSAVALGNAHGFTGDMASAYQARLTALEASRLGGNSYFSILAHLEVAITLREQGRLLPAAEICQQQLQLAKDIGLSQASVAGCLMSIQGEILAEQGDLEQANRLAKAGVERTEGGDLAMLGWSYVCTERVLFSTRDWPAATELVRKIERAARESDVPPWIVSQMAAWQARIALAQGQLEAASRWAHERALIRDGKPQPAQFLGYFPLIEHVVLARILIAQESLDQARELLQRLLTAAETGDRTTRVIEILALQALVCQAKDDVPRAMAALQRALTLAESGGFFQVFVDEGPSMGLLLHEAASRGMAPDYARRLLVAFPVTQPASAVSSVPYVGPPPSDDPRPPPSPLVEPLSQREIEVLELIAEGLTNPEIAARLYLALNTVKAHTRNIYGKLDVHSRTQAIARSRQLGLLPPSQG
jgi:LuxR family maltose regulon positive regulatory protein